MKRSRAIALRNRRATRVSGGHEDMLVMGACLLLLLASPVLVVGTMLVMVALWG